MAEKTKKIEKKVTVQVNENETLQEAHVRIQQSLKAPKSQYNSFSKFNYRSCEDILVAVKPLLGKFALTIDDEVVLIGDRYYIKATARLSGGKPDETGRVHAIHTSAFARESLMKKGMDEAQITGSASSYARKYALNGLFAIDDTKDDDAGKKEEVKKEVVSTADMKLISGILQDINNAKDMPVLEKVGAEIKEKKDLKPVQVKVLREAYASKFQKLGKK